MKRVIQLGIVWLTVITLGGCGMIGNTKQESNGALSAEHEALCNSKNTLNKTLCRETMGQLPKFTSEINTYFKEKFNIDGFKLTGISFPYGKVQHGGFNATFQLENNPYVMITSTFDYSSDKKYTIRPAINEDVSVSGQSALASAVLVAEYFKTLPIEKISKDLEELGITTLENKIENLRYGFDSGRYFLGKNIVSVSWNNNNVIGMSNNEQKEIIKNHINKSDQNIYEKYKGFIVEAGKINPFTHSENNDILKEKFNKYTAYLEKNPDMKKITQVGMIVHFDIYGIDESVVYRDEKGEMVING